MSITKSWVSLANGVDLLRWVANDHANPTCHNMNGIRFFFLLHDRHSVSIQRYNYKVLSLKRLPKTWQQLSTRTICVGLAASADPLRKGAKPKLLKDDDIQITFSYIKIIPEALSAITIRFSIMIRLGKTWGQFPIMTSCVSLAAGGDPLRKLLEASCQPELL